MKILIATLVLSLLPVGCFAAVYENEQAGYSLSLPSELRVAMKKTRDMKEAAGELMPFDYVNFRPKEAAGDLAHFELGVGVHWNRDKLGMRAFADKKDDGLRMGGARIKILSQGETVVAGIQGVRDDFRIRKPEGWKSYSRVIIPSGDKFYVFLCTLGEDTALPQYERVFQKIIDSFELLKNP